MNPVSSPVLPPAAQERPVATLRELFVAFAKIGLTSFGGGLSGWMLREFVHRRNWISEHEFLSGLALAQAFPGVNVVNLSIWIGYRLAGGRGALAGALGLMLPCMALALLVMGLFASLARISAVHVALGGVAAAAVGLSLQTGLRAARRAAHTSPSFIVMVATFVGIFVLRWPLLWVVGVLAPLSIALAYFSIRRQDRKEAA